MVGRRCICWATCSMVALTVLSLRFSARLVTAFIMSCLYGFDFRRVSEDRIWLYNAVGHTLSRSCSAGGLMLFLSGTGPSGLCRPTINLDDVRRQFGLDAWYLTEDPPILIVDGLVDHDVANQLVDMAERPGNFVRATIGADRRTSKSRTNYLYFPSREAESADGKMVETLVERGNQVAQLMPVHSTLDIQRTRPGEYYAPHHDYLSDQLLESSGPRLWAFLIALSDVAEGGAIEFPLLNVSFQPRLGRTLIFPHTFERTLLPDVRTIHKGGRVLQGIKYMANLQLHTDAADSFLMELQFLSRFHDFVDSVRSKLLRIEL